MKAPSPFSLELDAQLDSVPRARHELARWMDRSRVPSPIREELSLVVTELVTNAVEASPGPSARVSVWSCLGSNRVVLRVKDQGRGFRPPDDKPAIPHPTTDRGRGLPIVSALMDQMVVRRNHGQTEVEVSRRLPAAAQHAAVR